MLSESVFQRRFTQREYACSLVIASVGRRVILAGTVSSQRVNAAVDQ